jgi:hypothetical protein
MLIVGCDFHTRFQQIAMVDTTTGEIIERRLEHKNGGSPEVPENIIRPKAWCRNRSQEQECRDCEQWLSVFPVRWVPCMVKWR